MANFYLIRENYLIRPVDWGFSPTSTDTWRQLLSMACQKPSCDGTTDRFRTLASWIPAHCSAHGFP
jgi:hypothetical protein